MSVVRKRVVTRNSAQINFVQHLDLGIVYDPVLESMLKLLLGSVVSTMLDNPLPESHDIGIVVSSTKHSE